jgi:hypothetical protein
VAAVAAVVAVAAVAVAAVAAVAAVTEILKEILVVQLAVGHLLVTTHPPQALLVLGRHQHPPLVQILHVVKPTLGHKFK